MDPFDEGQDDKEEEEKKQKGAAEAAAAGSQLGASEDADRASRAADQVVGAMGTFAPSVDAATGGGSPRTGGGFNVGGDVWGAVDRTLSDQPERRPADFRSPSGTANPAAAATPAGPSSPGGTPPGAGRGASPSGFVDPAQTRDPEAVRAAQQALSRFQQQARDNWSAQGYDSQQHYEQALGNAQSGWLGSVTALARGQLDGGYQGQSWQPGVGWTHDVRAGRGPVAAAGPANVAARAVGDRLSGGVAGGVARRGEERARVDVAPALAGQRQGAVGAVAGAVGDAARSALAPGAGSASVAPQSGGFVPGGAQPILREAEFQPTAQGRPVLDRLGRVVGYR